MKKKLINKKKKCVPWCTDLNAGKYSEPVELVQNILFGEKEMSDEVNMSQKTKTEAIFWTEIP